ncbi:MAG TPA: DNA internalization-related competence protein ComEC/Rec2 [Vicinamibacterales bacterium]|nr:DNA internalization-related competence protein ComEC/Rec2 [Vicinamibacterales bacterium]
MRVPAAVIAIPLLAGSAAGVLLFERLTPQAATCLVGSAALAWMAALGAALDRDGATCGAAVAAGALLAGFALGLAEAGRIYSPPLRAWFERRSMEEASQPVILQGVLRGDASQGVAGISLGLNVEMVQETTARSVVAAPGGVRLTVAGVLGSGRLDEWRSGRRVRLIATLREPAVYLNPGRPDDRRALARRGIVLVGTVKSAALVEVLARAGPVAEAAGACRALARTRLHALVGGWSTRSAAIAAAILIGDRTGLGPDDERRLQEAGTYHVVAISGGNIALLTIVLLAACRIVRAPPRLAAGVAIPSLLFYGRITGPAPSVDRAITAAVSYLSGRLLDQHGPAVNVLATAAAIAVALSPIAVLDPGFILSFGATLGILVLVPRLVGQRFTRGRTPATRVRNPVPRRAAPAPIVATLAGLLAATVAAEIALAPVAAMFFGRVTFAGLVLNFAAIPLMGLVQAASIAALVLDAVAPACGCAAGYVVHLAATGLVESSRLVDVAPWLSRAVPPPSWWLVLVYYGAAVLALISRRARRLGIGVACSAGVLVTLAPDLAARRAVPSPLPGWLRVVVLDVGQGDATLVRLPDGRALLVDAGGIAAGAPQEQDGEARTGFDTGERVVGPALRALGVRRLDTFVLTHGDPDHLGGARSVLHAFRPRAVWEGVEVPPHQGLSLLARAADAAGAERRSVLAGDRLRIGPVTIRVLHPPPPDWERQRVRNEDSVVLDVRLGGVSIILPGDIGREGEQALQSHVIPASLVVLKVAHHGSATSSSPALLDVLRPAVAIVSAGRGNRFGHPAASVLARFRAMGTAIFSTQQHGAVFVDTNGEEVEVWGLAGGRFHARAAARADGSPR